MSVFLDPMIVPMAQQRAGRRPEEEFSRLLAAEMMRAMLPRKLGGTPSQDLFRSLLVRLAVEGGLGDLLMGGISDARAGHVRRGDTGGLAP